MGEKGEGSGGKGEGTGNVVPPLSTPSYEARHGISNNVVYVTSKASDQPGAFASSLNIL